jgi:hypothetical protein
MLLHILNLLMSPCKMMANALLCHQLRHKGHKAQLGLLAQQVQQDHKAQQATSEPPALPAHKVIPV